MCKGMKLFEKFLGKSVFHTRYIAHIINITVQTAYTEIQSCLYDLRNVVPSIRTTVKRRESFEELKMG